MVRVTGAVPAHPQISIKGYLEGSPAFLGFGVVGCFQDFAVSQLRVGHRDRRGSGFGFGIDEGRLCHDS